MVANGVPSRECNWHARGRGVRNVQYSKSWVKIVTQTESNCVILSCSQTLTKARSWKQLLELKRGNVGERILEESRKLHAWRGEAATRAPNYKVFIAELLLCRQQECLHHEGGSVSSNESCDSTRASLHQSLSNFLQTPLQLLPLTPASLPLAFCCGEDRPREEGRNSLSWVCPRFCIGGPSGHGAVEAKFEGSTQKEKVTQREMVSNPIASAALKLSPVPQRIFHPSSHTQK